MSEHMTAKWVTVVERGHKHLEMIWVPATSQDQPHIAAAA